ncbi:DUF1476 domain-containing protein [Parvularcula sp. LCG005]|uniref:DUF1476 domain-containing protein n=1 Tax=Parvularcula sp. LCG005 TaxID=3078805 RepID=UPI002943DF7E|nr:DUF1476 domain-containing protein [Parvularcula sp. LCG005]WOI52537.1 DUF1476 domain-containing protein [Parvularcula sp. LCG005]
MTTFDDREKRFETGFVLDAELRFKVEAKRDKLLGAWVAAKLGLSGADADEYARSVVRADLEEPGDDDVFRKVRADLDKSAKKVSDEEIRAKMAEYLDAAMNAVRP